MAPILTTIFVPICATLIAINWRQIDLIGMVGIPAIFVAIWGSEYIGIRREKQTRKLTQ